MPPLNSVWATSSASRSVFEKPSGRRSRQGQSKTLASSSALERCLPSGGPLIPVPALCSPAGWEARALRHSLFSPPPRSKTASVPRSPTSSDFVPLRSANSSWTAIFTTGATIFTHSARIVTSPPEASMLLTSSLNQLRRLFSSPASTRTLPATGEPYTQPCVPAFARRNRSSRLESGLDAPLIITSLTCRPHSSGRRSATY